jgi:uracil-DNA glycosylase
MPIHLRTMIPLPWRTALTTVALDPHIERLEKFLEGEELANQTVYPPQPNWFGALQLEPKKVRVVILGQDPYHGPQQAHGLCFSVLPPTPPPPSLVNIFKEIERTYPDFVRPSHGNLTAWVDQGVLLLNTTLTVRAHSPMSHKGRGWEEITDALISWIQTQVPQIIFVLWGGHAKGKLRLINTKQHIVLSSGHPSPLSVNAFMKNNHFRIINQLLLVRGEAPIRWQL